MANTIRIKRRGSGAIGAPSSLENAEIAFNEVDDVLYYGKGTGGAGGTATTIEPIAGKGAFLALTGEQSVDGQKTFSDLRVPTPTAPAQAVNKGYADSLVPNLLATAPLAVTPGAGNATVSLNNSGVTAGTYPKVTVNAKGLVTGGAALLASDVPTLNQNTTGSSGSCTGNAATATKLQNARTISATGDATGTSGNFDGSANASIALTLAASGVTAGTYPKVTVNAKGLVTAGAALAASDIPTLTAAKVSDFDTQVRQSRLDQMAAPTAAVGMNNQRLTGLAEPTAAQDAATKNYVDMAVQGLDPKGSVRAATTANIASLSGAMTIDGIALVAGDRVLVKDQTTANQNGIYVVQGGAWTRAEDGNTWNELVSAYVFVESGTSNADNGFLFTMDAGGTLGSTAITVVQFNGAGQVIAGNGLTKSGNALAVGAGTGIAVAATTVGLAGQALALHNLGTNGLVTRTASGAFASRAVAGSGSGVSVANGDGVSGNPTVSLSASLSTVGGLTPAADRLAYYTGAATAALTAFTAFARSLLDDADAAAARVTLGLGNMATQAANAVNITGGSIDGITFDGGVF